MLLNKHLFLKKTVVGLIQITQVTCICDLSESVLRLTLAGSNSVDRQPVLATRSMYVPAQQFLKYRLETYMLVNKHALKLCTEFQVDISYTF